MKQLHRPPTIHYPVTHTSSVQNNTMLFTIFRVDNTVGLWVFHKYSLHCFYSTITYTAGVPRNNKSNVNITYIKLQPKHSKIKTKQSNFDMSYCQIINHMSLLNCRSGPANLNMVYSNLCLIQVFVKIFATFLSFECYNILLI